MPAPVRMRLALHGQKHTPYFHIVVIKSTKPRNAKPIEKLGEYDPIPRIPGLSTSSRLSTPYPTASTMPLRARESPDAVVPKERKIVWDVDRIRYWLSVGAEPTPSVIELLEQAGILTRPHKWQRRTAEQDAALAAKWEAEAKGKEAEAAAVASA